MQIDFHWIAEVLAMENAPIEEFLRQLLISRFGWDGEDMDAAKSLINKHRLSVCYKGDNHEFIGVSLNSRWLYTPDGRVIGKKGNRFLL